MHNTTQKFRDSSILSRKSGILSKNLKHFTSSNYPTVQWFLLKNFAHVFCLPISTTGCVGFFLFHLDLELFAKNLKRPAFYKLIFYALLTHVNN